ncbi:MFS transporter [Fulvivirgaceae bacterium BMA12]|uniref:MFS transporter n=1 Tax=Agaribacillus aureus TaxID=3051825 RepID=A0ABT8LEJ3_9BACT|nr:MFS transporter [Fulvivirgaceae bacterium BMA12]
MKHREMGFLSFIAILALLMALVSITINMVLPAFQSMANTFQLRHQNQIQLVISLLYLGLGIGQLFYGPLSDSIGRKRTIYIGLILFITGCLVSYLSGDLVTLIAGQIIQGLGLGAPRVISLSIVRDRYAGNSMARAMSFIMVIYILTPIFSPILGKMVLMLAEWRTLFIVFIFLGLAVLLLFRYVMPETLPPERRKAFTVRHLVAATAGIVNNQISLGCIIILGVYSGVFITYLNLSQPIFEIEYQLGNRYPFYFASLALGIGLASFLNGKLVTGFGMEKLIRYAIWSGLTASVPFIILTGWYQGHPPLSILLIFLFIQLFCYGILIGNLSAMAMKPFGNFAGLAAAIIGALSTLISVPLSIGLGRYFNGSVMPLVAGFLVAGVVSIIIFHHNHQVKLAHE